jgi:hypothetical protein
MTIAEARTELDDLLDKAGSAYFTDAEKDRFLDSAIIEWCNEVYNMINTTQVFNDKSALLIKEDTATRAQLQDITDATDGSGQITDYWHLLAIKDSRGNNVKIIQIDDVYSTINDPFNRPDDSNPVAYFIQDGAGPPGQLRLEILGSNDTGDFTLLYYMQPELVSQSNDSTENLTDNIHEIYHREVIKLAARAILANIESPQYSTMRSEIAEQQQ